MKRFDYGTYGYIAKKDLDTARDIFTLGRWSAVGFYCQQCLERIAKHYILYRNINVDSSVMKTHKLKKLYNNINLGNINEALIAIYALTDCYYDSRYPGEDYYELDKESATKYLETTEEIFNYMCNLINKLEKPTSLFE